MPPETQDLAPLASTLHAAGYAPVPVTIDKAPRDPATGAPLSWKSYQTAPPSPEQIARWFGHPGIRGLGLVLSPQLPGRLACLDFDDSDEYRELDHLMRERDDVLSHAWERLHGWHETTPK